MLTYEQFLDRYPDFKPPVPIKLVEKTLCEAALEIDSTVWGRKTDTGHGLLTAHLLATSPYGRNARMTAKDGSSVYWPMYLRLVKIVAAKARPLI